MKLYNGFILGHFITKIFIPRTRITMTAKAARPIAISPKFFRIFADLQPSPLKDLDIASEVSFLKANILFIILSVGIMLKFTMSTMNVKKYSQFYGK